MRLILVKDLIILLFLLFLQFNETPLHNASSKGHIEIVQLLLDRNANKDIQTDVRAAFQLFFCVQITKSIKIYNRTVGQPFIWQQRRVIQMW